ncbi:hypothetical protein BK702_19430 [Bacillus thuringiensis serovar cameroun]|nr:hypothetical protein BK702_19430 [Bacillus thuringiensis serovar cameroun]
MEASICPSGKIDNRILIRCLKVPKRVLINQDSFWYVDSINYVVREKKKGMKYSPRSKRLSGINVYMTNTPA